MVRVRKSRGFMDSLRRFYEKVACNIGKRDLRWKTGIPLMIFSAVLFSGLLLAGCKRSDDARNSSFRANYKNWWFGQEKVSLLLHQPVLDLDAAEEAMRSPTRKLDPAGRNTHPQTAEIQQALSSLHGIGACWYAVHTDQKTLEPISQDMSAIYDLTQEPLTEYAVPFYQLYQTTLHMRGLRTLSTSLTQQVTRTAFDLPVELAINSVICSALVSVIQCGVGSVLAPATAGTSAAAGCGTVPWTISLLCGVAASASGVTDALKTPWDQATDPVEDYIADKVGDQSNDHTERTRQILSHLPLARRGGTQAEAILYDSLEKIPQLQREEIKKLEDALRMLGSSRHSVHKQGDDVTFMPSKGSAPLWLDGSKKKLTEDQRCSTISQMRKKKTLVTGQEETLPEGFANKLRKLGVPPQVLNPDPFAQFPEKGTD